MPRLRPIPPSAFAIWVLGTLALGLAFARVAAYNLANYRPVSNDEVELIAVAYKLANQAIHGSDLFAGFYGANQHYLMTLPVQHVLDAITFKLIGAGIAQARWVSVIAAVILIWSAGWLAYRWYGLATALLAELLLVLWPSNLTDAAEGLPLLGVARTARYDVLAVAFAWLALALLEAARLKPHQPQQPKPLRRLLAVAAGICCGLASLSQFIGAFVLPLMVVHWCWPQPDSPPRRSTPCSPPGSTSIRGVPCSPPAATPRHDAPGLPPGSTSRHGAPGWLLLGLGLVVLPYLAYVSAHAADFAGQLTAYGSRWTVWQPAFYLRNLLSEAARYRHLDGWLVILGIWPALAYLAWRTIRLRTRGDRILWSSLVVFSGLLLLLDQTKSPLYAIILLPSLCIALAVTSVAVVQWLSRPRAPRWLVWPARLVLLALAVTTTLDSVRAYQRFHEQALQVSHYLGLGETIDRALPADAHILGPERWWWALHDHPYLSLRSLWWQSSDTRSDDQPAAVFSDGTPWIDADTLIINDNVRADIEAFPDAVQRQFWAFVDTCTTPVTTLSDATYFDIEVRHIIQPSAYPQPCGPEPVGHTIDA